MKIKKRVQVPIEHLFERAVLLHPKAEVSLTGVPRLMQLLGSPSVEELEGMARKLVLVAEDPYAVNRAVGYHLLAEVSSGKLQKPSIRIRSHAARWIDSVRTSNGQF